MTNVENRAELGQLYKRLEALIFAGGDMRASHEDIVYRRNRVYAHTDGTPLRQMLSAAARAR
jgi:hypothetical protein